MASTPEAAKVDDDEHGAQSALSRPNPPDVMEIDLPATTARDGTAEIILKSRSNTPKGPSVAPAQPKDGDDDDDNDDDDDDDDDDEEADEETFAVEKVLNHRITTKGKVTPPPSKACR
jgi:hypothetical protein